MAELSVLENMYQQPGDTVSVSDGQRREITQKWKGPWSEILNVYSAAPIVCGSSLQIGQNFVPGSRWKSEYPLPDSFNWNIKEIRVQELQAGDHGELTMVLEPRDKNPSDPNLVSETWNLTWGTASVNPLAYCRNALSGSYAWKIQHCADYQKKYRDTSLSSLSSMNYTWIEDNPSRPLSLSLNEQKIYDLYIREVQGVLSYPQITLTKQWSGLTSQEQIAQKLPDWSQHLNVISANASFPDSVTPGPPAFLSAGQSATWKWIFRDFDVQQSKGPTVYQQGTSTETFDIQFRAQWQGCYDAEEVFYSSNDNVRWRLGQQ